LSELLLQYQKKLESGTKPQKKKNDKTQTAKEGYDVFQEGKDNFPPLDYILSRKKEIKMKHIIIIIVVALIVWYSGGNKNDN